MKQESYTIEFNPDGEWLFLSGPCDTLQEAKDWIDKRKRAGYSASKHRVIHRLVLEEVVYNE